MSHAPSVPVGFLPSRPSPANPSRLSQRLAFLGASFALAAGWTWVVECALVPMCRSLAGIQAPDMTPVWRHQAHSLHLSLLVVWFFPAFSGFLVAATLRRHGAGVPGRELIRTGGVVLAGAAAFWAGLFLVFFDAGPLTAGIPAPDPGILGRDGDLAVLALMAVAGLVAILVPWIRPGARTR